MTKLENVLMGVVLGTLFIGTAISKNTVDKETSRYHHTQDVLMTTLGVSSAGYLMSRYRNRKKE